MIQFIPYFIASYIIVFFMGRVWQREKDMAKQEEIHAARKRAQVYDINGRIKNTSN
ncbi:MAG: hypothetical protein AWM53_02022 [Candidatus Dichloromethanomonas elyunquensis]|nr:MAG: hypothetical protein AWM53_02022 [Candidatus Dichloromethanomonas elyunquensis]